MPTGRRNTRPRRAIVAQLVFHIAIIEVGPADLQAKTKLFNRHEALNNMRDQNTRQHIRTVHPGLVFHAA